MITQAPHAQRVQRVQHLNLSAACRVFLACTALLAACQDPPLTPAPLDQGFSVPPLMDQGVEDSSPPLEDLAPPPEDMEPPPRLRPAGWIELELSPSRVYYSFSDTPEVEAKVYDIYGELIEDAEPVFTLAGEIGSLSAQGPRLAQLTLNRDGEGALTACIGEQIGAGASGDQVCVRRAILVDDAPPSINVLWPQRGAQVASYDAPSVTLLSSPPDEGEHWLPVVAQIEDGQRELIVRLNGRVVELNEAGRLEAYLPAEVGYQEIDITVDDGVRLSVTRDRRWVLWADDYLSFDEDSSRLSSGAQFSLNQDFLDQDLPFSIGANPLIATELAQLIDMFLGLINPTSLLPSALISGAQGFSLSIEELSLGRPEVDIHFTEDGISLYLELNNVSLNTVGSLDLGGQLISLNGALNVGLAVFADFELGTQGAEQPLALSTRSSGVAITSVEADFENPTAEALIETFDNDARRLIVESVEGALQALIRDELPPLLEASVNSLFSTVDYIPFTLDSGLEGVPTLSLALEVSPERLEVNRQERASLWCDIKVSHADGPPLGPGEGITVRGVPLERASALPPELASAFTLHLQQSMLTQLLTEVWRGGLLSLSPPLPAEASALVSEASLTAQSPPVVVRGALGDPYPLYLELGGLHLEMSGPFAPETDEYEVFARVGASLIVDGGAFTVALEEVPQVSVALTKLRNTRPVLAEDILARVIASSVWPPLSAAITGQLRIGLEEAPLDVRAFEQLGVSFESAQISPMFDEMMTLRGGWMSLKGMIEARFER